MDASRRKPSPRPPWQCLSQRTPEEEWEEDEEEDEDEYELTDADEEDWEEEDEEEEDWEEEEEDEDESLAAAKSAAGENPRTAEQTK